MALSDDDYQFWDALDELSPSQGAFLWCDMEPDISLHPGQYPPKVAAIYDQIIEHHFGGVKCDLGGAAVAGRMVFGDSLVEESPTSLKKSKCSREDLKKLANHLGHHPRFLFPEARIAKSSCATAGEKPHGNALINAKKREEILGAALAILAAFPEQCRNKSGKIAATKLCRLVDSKALIFWPDTGDPPLKPETIEILIRNWLRKLDR